MVARRSHDEAAMSTIIDDAERLLRPTSLLDFHDPTLVSLVCERGWARLSGAERIGAIYAFVRDEIPFGYNDSDDLPASRVLADRLGQCNTKGTLLMALLRGVGVPCRLHGFTIHKALQKGALTGVAYLLAPERILHSWVEIWFDGRWVNLEGFIVDKRYLAQVQRCFADRQGAFCGFGIATPDLRNPPVEWKGTDTYIQKEGIADDLGIYDSPDAFYAEHGVNLGRVRSWLFQHVVRGRMNRNVARVREAGVRRAKSPVFGLRTVR
jgi:hypothetical protein